MFDFLISHSHYTIKHNKFPRNLRYFLFMGKKRKSLRHYRNYLRLHFIIIKTLYSYYHLITSPPSTSVPFVIIKSTFLAKERFVATIFDNFPRYFVRFLYVYKNIKKILIPKQTSTTTIKYKNNFIYNK